MILYRLCTIDCVESTKINDNNYNKYKKQLQKIERKVGMEYQKAYKQG